MPSSAVWNVFKKISEGTRVKCYENVTEKSKIKPCGQEYPLVKGQTSHMKNHIQKKHPETYKRYWPAAKVKVFFI